MKERSRLEKHLQVPPPLKDLELRKGLLCGYRAGPEMFGRSCAAAALELTASSLSAQMKRWDYRAPKPAQVGRHSTVPFYPRH